MKFRWIFIFFVFLSCRTSSPVFPPGWELTLTVSNSARAFKITFGWKRSESDSTRTLFFVKRANPSTDFLDYREEGILRAGMLDTFELTTAESADLHEWTQAADWENTASEGTGDQVVMTFNDGVSVSFIGMPTEKNKRQFIEWAWRLFENKFPKIDFSESEIELTIVDRIHNRNDSVRIIQNKSRVNLVADNREKNLTHAEYIELWRVLENFKIWELAGDRTYSISYPIEYRLTVRRDGRAAGWTVFAPSKLSDKRYYYIVNAVETAGIFQTAGGL